MGNQGLSRKPAEIFREVKPFIGIPGMNGRDSSSLKDQRVSPGPARQKQGKENGYPVSLMLRHNHYRYRGNRLSDLVPDLASMAGEGALGLPDSLMLKLKVKEGDRVRIVSEHGEMDTVVCSRAGQNCQSACLLSNGKDPSGILDGVYPDNLLVNVKIDKI